MKTKQFSWLLATLLLVVAMAMPTPASAAITPSAPANGDGTSSNPYQISNAAELYWFAALVNNTNIGSTANYCAKLTTDITVNSNVLNPDGTLNTANAGSFTAWTPIGNSFIPYSGTFDGDNHTISGLYFNDSDKDYVGLFACNNGSIHNVGIIDSYFKGNNYIGSVCGENTGVVISNGNTEASINKCYNTGTVSGNSYVGGVCGSNTATLLSTAKMTTAAASLYKCYNEGSVSGAGNVGGVCGENRASAASSGKTSSAEIRYCYNIGIVSGTESVGGVCGNNYAQATGGRSTATIEYCHNTNAVISSGSVVGGVCGVNNSSSSSGGNANAKINRCYYNSDKYSGTAVSNNNCTNTEGRTTAQFKSGEVAYLLQQSEPFSEWGQTIGTDDYPVIGGAKVYYYYTKCSGKMIYSNQEETAGHCYINGNCIECGAYQLQLQPAPKNGDVYEISNAGQLYWFAALVNGKLTDGTSRDPVANAKLMADIVVNKNVLNENGELNHRAFTSWTPIGYFNSLEDYVDYWGKFDGNGHTISGLYYNDSYRTNVGLFGLTGCGTLKNIGVVDSYFNGKNSVGGISGEICGYLSGYAIIVNCYFTGSVSGSDKQVGGLCGFISDSNITNCYYNSDNCTGKAIGTNRGTATKVEGKTTEQFKSGEVAYLLSQGTEGSVWGQQLGTDDYPVLSDYKVIKAAKGDKDANENDTYWATFSNLNSDVTLSVPSDRTLKVYNATVSGGTLTLSERTDNQVAKEEGVLLKTDGEYVNVKTNETNGLTVADYANNNLVATPATEQTITADNGFTLYRLTYNNSTEKTGLGFYLGLVKDSDGNVTSQDGSQLNATPGKAYLKVATAASIKPLAAAPTRGFPFSGEGETTGFGEIVIEGDAGISGTANADGRIYNLQGQQVTAPAKGLYIKNNKKVIIK